MARYRMHDYEILRQRCVALKQVGWSPTKIKQALGVSEGWVSVTLKKYRQGGAPALANKPIPGPSAALNDEQLSELLVALNQGAEAHGFAGQVWTRKRVGVVIDRLFGVSYEVSQVGRILKKVGWSKQKPQRKAIKQDAQAVEQWQNEQLPELKKKQLPKTKQ